MQTSWNFFYFLSKLPYLFVLLAMAYVFIKVCKSFFEHCFSYSEDPFFRRLYNFFDPYHQSFFCYKYKWFTILLLIGAIYLLCKNYIPPEYIKTEKGMYVKDSIMYNTITYFIDYITHEMLGHNTFCPITPQWFCYFSGSFVQILLPVIVYLFSLQLRGGLLFSPAILYWLSSSFYHVGIYSSDALVSRLALTSSDMVTDHAAGIVKGDWYYILGPFNALDYAETIGMVFEVVACIMLAFAIYSFIEYSRRLIYNEIRYDHYK